MKALVCVAVLPFFFFATPAFAKDAAPKKVVKDAATDAKVVTKDAAIAKAKAEVKDAEKDAEKITVVLETVKNLFSNGWRAGIAGVIALLMFFWRRFDTLILAKIPNAWLPVVVAGVAFLAAIPASLTADPWSWKTFIWQGLITGAQAMAFWSIALKHVLKKFLPEGQ